MKTYLTVSFAMLTGFAMGGFAVQGLQAQGKKVYTVTELQVLDAKLSAELVPRIVAAQAKLGGRTLNTGGKITAMEGTAPERVAITEWQSLANAQEFYKTFHQQIPERAKATKTVRQYAVEER